MAETSDVGLLPRTYFKLPRVPFDFRAVALGTLGYLTVWAGDLLWSQLLTSSKVSLVGAFLTWFVELLRGLPVIGGPGGLLGEFLDAVFGLDPNPAETMEIVVGGAWFFGAWAFFGQAVRRVVALRIARDEGLSLREALSFAAKNWVTMLLAPVVVGVAVGIFWGCNWLAGLVLGVPVLGSLLSVVLVPLAALSTLLMLLIALGGVLGMPLMGAAAAWEKNGSLDAISRAFSYVFARPLQYFFNFFLILLFTGIVLFAGSWFIAALTRSVESGVLFSDRLAVALDVPPTGRMATKESLEEFKELSEDAQKDVATYAELTKYSGRAKGGVGVERGIEAPHPFVRDFRVIWKAPWYHWLTLLMFWTFVNLIWVGVFGYALFWFLGASCCLYADLRYDVDGTPEDEIHTDEDEQPIETGVGGPDLPPAPAAPPPGTVEPPSSPPPPTAPSAS